MRLVLAISSLGAGGAERVMTLLAGALADRGHEVWLVTLAGTAEDFFPLDPRVRRIGLDLMGDSPNVLLGAWANLRRLRALRRIVAGVKPVAILSFMTSMNVLMILACGRRPVRVIVSERVDPDAHRENRVWTELRSLLYHYADAVVVQSDNIAAWFRRRLRPSTHVLVIPNPVAPVVQVEPIAQQGPFLLAAGRLAHQKGFDLLIRAFATATAPQLQLVIAGEGPEGQHLRDLATELGLGARVSFVGRVRNLSALMKAAVAFVLPSRYEGFPNVLLEALVAGVPCVAADGPGATREILADGAYGLLVPAQDCRALAEAIDRISIDSELRRRYAQAGPAAAARYGLDRVVSQWERVLAGG
jgi:GalNAc-alpha-(1->4)-GalNAc-alpha-(1->3)-diNAcBac-PP-undecaprenol alpha-1,4-N-acetyl-D-galactosaminyltransferase